MRLDLSLLAAPLVACLAATPAAANTNVYYHVGSWDAFDGQAANGQPMCGLGSHNPADGRSISFSFQIGGTTLTFIASKPGWNIPDGTQVPVVMQLGLHRPWVEQASGSGQRLTWTMDQADAPHFDAEFRNAASMSVTFPSGNERPWIISLNGSNAISNAMRRCVADLSNRESAAQAAPAPAAPQSSTQPFNAPPAAAGNPPPATAGNAAPAGQASAPPAASPSPAPAPSPAPSAAPSAAPSPAPSH